MTPELIAGLVGVAFSLGMEYIPWFANWYNALEDVKQRLVPVGLGLVVVKKLVEDNDGSIDIRSIPEKGTTFIISFPIEEKGEPNEQREDIASN